jgi:NRPS condensation-like uncharacterized protein
MKSLEESSDSNYQIKAEVFDQIQFFFEENNCNDHQLHCVINFDNHIDKNLIKKAVLMSLDIVPILSCRYAEDYDGPSWYSIDKSKYEDAFVFIQCCNPDAVLNKVITSKTSAISGPQVKVFVISSYKDILCIIMNHMVCDAAGFKEYIYLLSDLYSKLMANSKYAPENIMLGSRSLTQVTQNLAFTDKLKAITRPYKPRKQKNFIFPLSSENKIEPIILTYKIPRNRYHSIIEMSKKYKVTINDIILSAYYRTLYRVMNIKEDKHMEIPLMIDMRRYLKDRKAESICNLTSIIPSSIKFNSKDTFIDTLMKVNGKMNLQKNSLPGIGDFQKLSMAFKTFKYYKIKKLMKNLSVFPPITLTNIGIIDSKKIKFKSSIINNIFMNGSIKYPPYFQLALSTFNETITFSINLYGSEKDIQKVNWFFKVLDEELPGSI